MLEDFSSSGGVASDAYFDDISLPAVPEPSRYAMLLGEVAMSAGLDWRGGAAARQS
jgi:hypothetical protein